METLINRVNDILLEDGYRPSMNNAKTLIAFKVEGEQIDIYFEQNDSNYIKILSLYNIDSNMREKTLNIANQVNVMYKFICIKVYETSFAFCCDSYVDVNMNIKAMLQRYIGILLAAMREFKKIYFST